MLNSVYIAICLLILCGAMAHCLRARSIDKILCFSIIIHLALWYIVPGSIYLFFDYHEVAAPFYERVSPDDFLQAFVWQGLATALSLFLFVIISENRGGASRLEKRQVLASDWVLKLLLPLYFALIAVRSSRIGSYLDNNSAEMYTERAAADGLSATALAIFMGYAFYHASTATRLRMIDLGLLIALALHVFVEFFSGSRIALLIPLAIICVRYVDRRGFSVKNLALIAFGFVLILNVVLPTLEATQTVRQNREFVASDIVDQLATSRNSTGSAEIMFRKSDLYSSGHLLLEVSGVGVAGFAPYEGSLLVFIPTSIVQSRPVAGSIDGTVLGHPTRLVPHKIIRRASDSINVGVAPLHVSIWQFGYFGVALFLFGGCMYLVCINWLLKSGSPLEATLGIFLIGYPSTATLLPSPDMMLKQLVIVAVVWTALSFVQWLIGPSTVRQRQSV